MNAFDATLAVRAYRAGRGLRTSLFRHRRLADRPLVVIPWQLGAEPFAAAAIGCGDRPDRLTLAVAGEPRNRDLAFAALLKFARWFNPAFEAHFGRVGSGPQILVANRGVVDLLRRLGRRLAFLPTDGPHAAAPDLVRLGRHLLFLWLHAAVPGQQLLVALTDLLDAHWATALSEVERQSLAALDAYIEPPAGVHGCAAAAQAEDLAVGPVPPGDADKDLAPLVEEFNRARASRTDAAAVAPLLPPIEAHYLPMTQAAWELLWRCRGRELRYPEAASVGRRWQEDCEAYQRHLDWLAKSGLRRTRQSPRQAAMTLRNLEEAQRLVVAEEACDDPLRMAPYILENKAVRGRVVHVNATHTEPGARRAVKRPLVTLASAEPCLMPAGKELWWAGQPAGREFVVESVAAEPGGGSRVTLKLMTSSSTTGLPAVGSIACFSVHSTAPRWLAGLPATDPWTHRAATPPPAPAPIEDEGERS
jgi:hypothetical protein